MRLIDADALDREMYRKSFEVDDGRNVWNSGLWIRYKIYEEAVRDAPTIDAVPVIRCKNCMFSEPWYRDKRRCFLWSSNGIDVFEDGFCNYAERKEKDGE